MTPAEALRKAADLVEPNGQWCQNAAAIDREGNFVSSGNPMACRWCAEGSLYRVTLGHRELFNETRSFLFDFLGQEPFEFNDAPNRTQPEVVAALRAAADKWDAENGEKSE